MNLNYLISIILKKSVLIVGAGILFAGIVYLLQSGQPVTYSSSTTLYSGHSFEVFREDNASPQAVQDDFIQLVRSRSTAEKTAIRLIAQHLLLAGPDPEFCMPSTWQAIRLGMPMEIRALADTLISVPAIHLGHESPGVPGIDRAGEDPRSLEAIPGYLRTVQNLTHYLDTHQDNYITDKLQSSDPIYGIAGISSVRVVPIRNSGLFNLTFSSIDPAVAAQTLKILTQVARSEYLLLHAGQGDLVRGYFAKKVAEAKHRLDSLEQNFMDFSGTLLTSVKKERDRRKAFLAAALANDNSRPDWILKYHCEYDEFGPMGGILRQMDREINLAQQNYLHYLDNFNLSILYESWRTHPDITVIDGPAFPAGPDPDRKYIWVLLAFVSGILAAGLWSILHGKHDRMIRSAGRLEKLSGLKLIGTFPAIPENPIGKVNYPQLSTRAIDQIVQRIRLEDQQVKDHGEQPFILFLISTREKEGKTYLATRITEKLRATGSKVLYVKPREKKTGMEARKQFISFNQPGQAWDFEYPVPENFNSVKNINELLRNYAFLTKGFHFLVIELPALLATEYPATLVKSGNLAILVCKATGTWTHSDREAISLYQAGAGHTVLGLLNFTAVNENF